MGWRTCTPLAVRTCQILGINHSWNTIFIYPIHPSRNLPQIYFLRNQDVIECVITINYNDNMMRTQISVDEDLYHRAKQVAKKHGISLAELCRQGLAEMVAREPSDKPWMAYAGILDGREDDSASVDEVVYGRESL